MIKKLWLSIVNAFWNFFYEELSDAQVHEFYDKFSNYFELAQYLQANGFEWKSDSMNLLPIYKLDSFERPNQVLARRWANCSGYMRLFSDFIRYKRCADKVRAFGTRFGISPSAEFDHGCARFCRCINLSRIGIDEEAYLNSLCG